MKLITKNGNGFLFSETHGHAVYFENPGEKPGKILKVVTKAHDEAEWAKKNWGCEPQEPTKAEMLLLEKTAPIRKGIQTLAVKNPKASSLELKQSTFFKVPGGVLSRASGTTYRKTHQGSNDWYLYNFEKLEGLLSIDPLYTVEEPIDFGTFYGEPNYWLGLSNNQLQPILKEEWERLTGRTFNTNYEFSWFHSTVKPYEVRGYNEKNFPGNDFRGLYLFDLSNEKKEAWIDELTPVLGRAYICYAHGNGDHTVPNVLLKEILDGGNFGEKIFVASENAIQEMANVKK